MNFPATNWWRSPRAYPDFYHESPHNILLDALDSQGIPGLLVLGGFVTLGWLAAGRQCGRALSSGRTGGRSHQRQLVCFTLTGALTLRDNRAAVGLGLSESDTQLKKSIGDRVPYGRGSASSRKERRHHSEPRTSASGVTLFQHLAIHETPRAFVVRQMATVPMALLFLSFAVELILSDVFLARAKSDLKAGRITGAIAAYAKSQHWHTAGSSDDLYFSRALAAASRSASPQAFAIAKRAVKTSEERQNAWYNLAGFYSTRNDLAGIETCFAAPSKLPPTGSSRIGLWPRCF